jgi:hypothetical protein
MTALAGVPPHDAISEDCCGTQSGERLSKSANRLLQALCCTFARELRSSTLAAGRNAGSAPRDQLGLADTAGIPTTRLPLRWRIRSGDRALALTGRASDGGRGFIAALRRLACREYGRNQPGANDASDRLFDSLVCHVFYLGALEAPFE